MFLFYHWRGKIKELYFFEKALNLKYNFFITYLAKKLCLIVLFKNSISLLVANQLLLLLSFLLTNVNNDNRTENNINTNYLFCIIFH